MFNISFGEICVFIVIALIILGPEKLPETLRTVLKKYQHFKQLFVQVQKDLENELELIELKNFMQEELNRIKENERQLQAALLDMQQKIEQPDMRFIPAEKLYPSYLYTKAKPNLAPYHANWSTLVEVKHAA